MGLRYLRRNMTLEQRVRVTASNAVTTDCIELDQHRVTWWDLFIGDIERPGITFRACSYTCNYYIHIT
jgi:hypothetical protein